MKKTKNILIMIALVLFAIVFVGSSCSKSSGSKTSYAAETTSSSGCFSSSSTTTSDWIKSKITEGDASVIVGEYTDEEKALLQAQNHIDNLVNLINTYINKAVVASSDDVEEQNQNYIVAKVNIDQEKYLALTNTLTKETVVSDEEGITEWISQINGGSNGCSTMFNVKLKQEIAQIQSNILSEDASEIGETNVYRIAALYVMQENTRLNEVEPIKFKGDTFGEFMAHLWNNLFIFPIGWLFYAVSKLFGGYYWVGLVLVTLAIRTLGWPIYSKSNDMTSRMSEMQPELTKIQEKYANRQDPESQRMMQMEQAQLYKKYKIGIGGCLAPFLQFPIFLAVFRAVSRIPYTVNIPGTSYTLDWANELNPNFLGVNLFEDISGGGAGQMVGIIIFVIIVVGTQILTQVLTKHFQKQTNEKKQENIPEYRRQAVAQQQNQQQSSMKIMMYMMVVMMGVFVWTSKAGLGLYWIIGNFYALGQMWVNNRQKLKKIEESNKKSGLYVIDHDDVDKKKK